MKKSLIALTSLALAFPLGIALVFSLQSIARANFNQIHRSTGGGRDRVVVPNQTPGSSVPLMVEVTRNRTLTLNACGWGRFQHRASATVGGISDIKINGGAIAPTFVAGAVPTCTNGVSNVNHPVGAVFMDGTVSEAIWYVRGGTGVGSIVAAVSSMNVVRAKANNCGFAQFRITASRPFTVFEDINANSYDLGTLPTTNTVGLVCRKIGQSYIIYAPASGF